MLTVYLLFTVPLLLLLLPCNVAGGRYDIKYGRHNISMGARTRPPYWRDTLLFSDNPRVKSSWMQVQSMDIYFPPKGVLDRSAIISFFNVTDQMPRKEDAGYAFVTSGGVGSNALSIHLKSQRGSGLDFRIDVYGYRYR